MKKSRFIAVLLAAMMLLAMLGGCTRETSSPSSPPSSPSSSASPSSPGSSPSSNGGGDSPPAPIKFTAAFSIGAADGQDGPFDDWIAQEIMKITGVEIENISIGESQDARETKLNMLLATGDYPEIIRMQSGQIMDKYIEEGVLIPLDDLIEQYGPNIKAMYGDTLKKLRNRVDGHVYGLTAWHGFPPNIAFFAMNIKHDLLKEFAPEIADSHDYITPDKFYELLKAFREKYPTIDGMESIGMTSSIDQRFYDGDLTMLGVIKAAFGISGNYEDPDNNLLIELKHPNYLRMLQYVNKLYQEGLIDPEFPTLGYQLFAQKTTQGNAFAVPGAWFELMAANQLFAEVDPDSQYYSYVIAEPGVTPRLAQVTDVGGNPICITTKCSDPVRAIQFLDFLASPDGNMLTHYGPQGTLWDIQDGVRSLHQEKVDEFLQDANAFWTKYKIRIWNIVNMDEAELPKLTFADGTTYREPPEGDKTPFLEYYQFALDALNTTGYDPMIYDGIAPPAGTDEFNILTQYGDIKEGEILRIIVEAKTPGEVESRLNDLIARANNLGIEKVESYMSAKYKENLAMLG